MVIKKKKKETTIDDLAIMIGKGFEDVGERIESLKESNAQEHEGMGRKLNSLEQGQEDIKIRLDNVAYRFELVELQKRVEVLERRNGIKIA